MNKKFAWIPNKDETENSNISRFINYLNRNFNIKLKNYDDLYLFSIEEKQNFWSSVWEFTQIIGDRGNPIILNEDSFESVSWFPSASLNYTENLLSNRSNDVAILFNNEHHNHKSLTYCDLYKQVSKTIQFFNDCQIKKGDRIALFVNNTPEAVVCVLAASAIGAISSLCSTDFGAQGVIDRFSQIEPQLLIYSEISRYNGKTHSQNQKIDEITEGIKSIRNIICLNSNETQLADSVTENRAKVTKFTQILSKYKPTPIKYERVPFSHPLYIVYSSGTTGAPKCIVHGHGGVLLQHKKEHLFHCDINLRDKVFYYTTCGWMMWQWLISALSVHATIILYNGSPFYPNNFALLKYLDSVNVKFLGTSAKYIDTLRKEKLSINETLPFKFLKTIGSTGSPLISENFTYIYNYWKKDVCVSSLSGGTDILSCFVLGCPIKPVIMGEIQCLGLGMQMDVFDENGKSLQDKPGELVCTTPFPSMPVCFWNDPKREKYFNTYLKSYKNVWCQGDWALITSEKGCIIYGRSDATLNPGGVRIGTAEIYRQVEQFECILESVITEYYSQGDSRIVLFVKLNPGNTLNQELIDKIKKNIKNNCSPRHVPALILSVCDIPRTKSGKLMELVVKNVINNKMIQNTASIQNPESLDCFKDVIPSNF